MSRQSKCEEEKQRETEVTGDTRSIDSQPIATETKPIKYGNL